MITVHKLTPQGEEVFSYMGRLIEQTATHLILEADFSSAEELVVVAELTLERGDRFVEYHYSDRWYNIFTIFNGETGQLKGWYCNINRPARIEDHHIYSEDLALDLVVMPDGTWKVLDEDEFEDLSISDMDRLKALEALEELQNLVREGEPPFNLKT